jgi:predicted MFS family arabinose efflux permease
MMDSITPKRRRAVFLVAVLAYSLSQFYRSFLTVITDQLAADLGVGPRELGILGGTWFIVFAFAQFPVGVMLDRIGPRRTMAGLMVASIIGCFLFSEAQSVTMGTIAMAMIGLGCSPVLMGVLYFFARTETPQRFAALGSTFLGIGLVGGLLAATPLSVLVEAVGWRNSFRLVGVITIASTLLLAVVVRDPPRAKDQAGGIFGAVIALFRMPAMWPILVMSIFVTAEVWTARSLWIGPFFGEVHGLGMIERGNAAFAMGVAMAISASLAGPIAERIGNPKRVVVVATIGSALGFLALAAWPSAPFVVAMALVLIIGLFGASYAVMIAHARLFMPAHVIGRGITLVNFLSIGMTGVLQYASGIQVASMKSAGMPAADVYGNLHLLFGLLMLGAVSVYLFAPAKPETQA